MFPSLLVPGFLLFIVSTLGNICVVTFKMLALMIFMDCNLTTTKQNGIFFMDFLAHMIHLSLLHCSVMRGLFREDLHRWVLPWVVDLVLTLLSNSSHLWLVVQDLCPIWVVQVALGGEALLGATLTGPTTNVVDTKLSFFFFFLRFCTPVFDLENPTSCILDTSLSSVALLLDQLRLLTCDPQPWYIAWTRSIDNVKSQINVDIGLNVIAYKWGVSDFWTFAMHKFCAFPTLNISDSSLTGEANQLISSIRYYKAGKVLHCRTRVWPLCIAYGSPCWAATQLSLLSFPSLPDCVGLDSICKLVQSTRKVTSCFCDAFQAFGFTFIVLKRHMRGTLVFWIWQWLKFGQIKIKQHAYTFAQCLFKVFYLLFSFFFNLVFAFRQCEFQFGHHIRTKEFVSVK